MTLEELSAIVRRAAWFSCVGEFCERDGALPLAAVASSDAWDWLPTSRDQADPVHGVTLIELTEREGKATARLEAEMAIFKEVLASMRPVCDPHPRLIDGPHNFTRAAKGGAQYAARMAAREIVAGRPDFWCGVMREYGQGFWPCGLSKDKQRLIIH